VLIVVAVSVGATSLFTRGDSVGNPPTATSSTPTNVDASGVASADDTGTVKIIIDEPTCAAWTPINNTLAEKQGNGWNDRDIAVPATAWGQEQRAQYESVATALRDAADQAIPLTKKTPHRIVRELYEQFIAYSRAYAYAVPTYVGADDHLARASVGISTSISSICDAITYGAARARAAYLPAPACMSATARPGDISNPARFLATVGPVCADWAALVSKFTNDTVDWRSADPNIPAAQWDPAQRAINVAAEPVISQFATDASVVGRRSDNPTLRDFAVLASQYRLAYAYALATYTPADHYLQQAPPGAVGTISEACSAAEA
jgi:hypothetical protein